jgi:hypothetical protein
MHSYLTSELVKIRRAELIAEAPGRARKTSPPERAAVRPRPRLLRFSRPR